MIYMKKIYKILVVFLLFNFIFLNKTMAYDLLPNNFSNLTRNEKIGVLKEAIKKVKKKIEKIISEENGGIVINPNVDDLVFKNYDEQSDFVSVYDIKNGEIFLKNGIDNSKNREVFELFSKIATKKFIIENNFNEYKVFDNRNIPIDANVIHSGSRDIIKKVVDNNGYRRVQNIGVNYVDYWKFYINYASFFTNGSNLIENEDAVQTLIHEMMHVITLNNKQTNFYIKRKDCIDTYYTGFDSCSNKNSYINKFVNRFWSKDDLLEIQKNKNSSSGKEKFYKDNTDKFVTMYASTNPEEDIVESFVDFVYFDKIEEPERIADQKVNFFYEFPKLVKIREHIRSVIFK